MMEVKVDRGEQHLIIHKGEPRPTVSHTGDYDKDILCADCDNILGRYESYVFELFRKIRRQHFSRGNLISIDSVDGDMLVRFASGIAWKYAVTKPERGRIDIGPYTNTLRIVSLTGGPIPDAVDVTIARIVELDGDVYYYRAPKPDRKEGVNVVRFCLGGFLIFLKIDKRPPGKLLPEECWLRGRKKGAFAKLPAEYIEEATLHAELASRKPVRQFFGKMRERKSPR
ncbi:hypothetical protein [Sulfitobacter pontiacus]|uniref:hypothetical protein n=2 Tax=Sulfitobacter pontiacus TaxID=60137 RepID=UPI0013629047|nr:hypothetical protein [Sulfitobacter pontiacus]